MFLFYRVWPNPGSYTRMHLICPREDWCKMLNYMAAHQRNVWMLRDILMDNLLELCFMLNICIVIVILWRATKGRKLERAMSLRNTAHRWWWLRLLFSSWRLCAFFRLKFTSPFPARGTFFSWRASSYIFINNHNNNNGLTLYCIMPQVSGLIPGYLLQ